MLRIFLGEYFVGCKYSCIELLPLACSVCAGRCTLVWRTASRPKECCLLFRIMVNVGEKMWNRIFTMAAIAAISLDYTQVMS